MTIGIQDKLVPLGDFDLVDVERVTRGFRLFDTLPSSGSGVSGELIYVKANKSFYYHNGMSWEEKINFSAMLQTNIKNALYTEGFIHADSNITTDASLLAAGSVEGLDIKASNTLQVATESLNQHAIKKINNNKSSLSCKVLWGLNISISADATNGALISVTAGAGIQSDEIVRTTSSVLSLALKNSGETGTSGGYYHGVYLYDGTSLVLGQYPDADTGQPNNISGTSDGNKHIFIGSIFLVDPDGENYEDAWGAGAKIERIGSKQRIYLNNSSTNIQLTSTSPSADIVPKQISERGRGVWGIIFDCKIHGHATAATDIIVSTNSYRGLRNILQDYIYNDTYTHLHAQIRLLSVDSLNVATTQTPQYYKSWTRTSYFEQDINNP